VENGSQPGLKDVTEMSRLKEQIALLQNQLESPDASHRDRVRELMKMVEDERSANQRYIDELAHLTQDKDDLCIRLRMTEEHLGESRRDNLTLKDEVQSYEDSLRKVQEAYEKILCELRNSGTKIHEYKNEKDRYEKLYKEYKDKMEVEMIQKDGKIAQQEKLITHLQSQKAPKKTCCRSQGKSKSVGGMTTEDLERALNAERVKNVDLTKTVRQLEQQVTEKRSRQAAIIGEAEAITNDAEPVPVAAES